MCPTEYLHRGGAQSYNIALQNANDTGETIVYVDFDIPPTTEILNAVSLMPVMSSWDPTKAIVGNSIVITCPEDAGSAGGYDMIVEDHDFTIETYGYAPYLQFGVYSGNTKIWPT